mmetsp:Transcript_26919/g.59116  ORF Transcript_26919/g.59116 Transcript_26919/m.59116 type:complete len:410 (+) Transcript_26919:172-1401(+)
MTSEDSQLSTGLESSSLSAWLPRITGAITLVSGIFILYVTFRNKDQMFHRLMLGVAVYLSIFGIVLMYGIAAIPGDTIDGNHETITACSVQGFFFYLSSVTFLFYYSSLSVYSYAGVLCNFSRPKYAWIEKYIHVLVHIYTLTASAALLVMNGFKDTKQGFCALASIPQPCGDPENIPCERGFSPNKNGLPTYRLAIIIPYLFTIIFPTIIMVLLYYKVKQNQSNIPIEAKYVANQAAIYLSFLYWGVVPILIAELLFFLFRTRLKGTPFMLYWTASMCNFSLFGVWCICSYRYFLVDEHLIQRNDDNLNTGRREGANDAAMPTNIDVHNANGDESSGVAHLPPETRARASFFWKRKSNQVPSARYSFNIFDGSNASGGFANFVFEGDQEDERADKKETDLWKGVQDHV